MGSFNQTCALSNLPINCGDHLRWLLLIESPYGTRNNHIPPDCFYIPRSIPVRAEYADYGEVKGRDKDLIEDSYQYKLWLELFKKDLVEKEQGANQYHDLEVKHNLTLAKLQDFLHEDLLSIREEQWGQNEARELKVKKAYIREDVWQEVLNLTRFWQGYKKVKGKYITITTDVHGLYKSILEECIESVKRKKTNAHGLETLGWGFYAPHRKTNGDFKALPCLLGSSCNGLSFPFVRGVPETLELILDEVFSEKSSFEDKHIQEALRDLAELWVVTSFLSSRMQAWAPSLYAGQKNHWDVHQKFHRAMSKLITKAKKKEKEYYS